MGGLKEKALAAFYWLRQQSWWPSRKWWTDTLTFAGTWLALKLGLGADDPWLNTGISLGVAKLVSYLVPPRVDEPGKGYQRMRAAAKSGEIAIKPRPKNKR